MGNSSDWHKGKLYFILQPVLLGDQNQVSMTAKSDILLSYVSKQNILALTVNKWEKGAVKSNQ